MKKFIYLFIISTFISICSNAQPNIGNYSFQNIIDNYIPLSGDSTINIDFENGISNPIDIGFDFQFGNRIITQFKLNSNGFMTFSLTPPNYFGANVLASSTTKEIIAPFGADLTGGTEIGSRFSILRTGPAPNRIFKIQWSNLERGYDDRIPQTANFQVWLYEGTNVIEVHYGGFLAGIRTQPTQIQVGLKQGSTSTNDVRSVTGATWQGAVGSNSSDASITASTTSLPDSNRMFRFTPNFFLNDVGVAANISPIGTFVNFPTTPLAPKAIIRNTGTNNQTSFFGITYKITGPVNYTSTKQDTIPASSLKTIIFDSSFIPNTPGIYNVVIYTSLVTDQYRANDTLKTSFTILNRIFDVQPFANLTPAGTVPKNSATIAPKATFKNIGTVTAANFSVTYNITGPVNFSSTKVVDSIPAGLTKDITFDSAFTPNTTGAYNVTIYSSLIPDSNKSNDTLKISFQIQIVNPTYSLTATNFSLNCGEYTSLEWDIYIYHNNAPAPFEYAGGEYYFDFDPSIANGGTLTYSIVGSDLPLNLQPRNPQVFGSQLRLALNVLPGAGNGYIMTNNGFPGTKIARVRLTTSSTSFSGDGNQINLEWRNGPSNPFTKIYAYVNSTITNITTPSAPSIDPRNCGMFIIELMPWDCCNAKLLSLNVAMEGFYNPSTHLLNRKDTVTVELRDAVYPYTIRHIAKCRMDSINLSSFYVFTYFWFPPQSFYVVVRHLNSIETWSKVGVDLYRGGYVNSYNFTTSDTAAYGNNLTLKENKYCIYSGDVNQDGIIDVADLSLVENDVYNLESGNYLSTDLNGDNIVDLTDLVICDNNVYNLITAITPLNNIDAEGFNSSKNKRM